jgi:hypothetical protein
MGSAPVFFGRGSRIWQIFQHRVGYLLAEDVGFDTQTQLRCWDAKSSNYTPDIVMEDSARELSKHLPILLAARGRVVVTGLGLGCVVRGLLANPAVEHIDVVEIDAGIIKHVWPEFEGTRAEIHHFDALKFHVRGKRWDFAWHDLHVFGDHLQILHARLIGKYRNVAARQGAWAFPRIASKGLSYQMLGQPRVKRTKP